MKHRVKFCLFALAAVSAASVPQALAQTYVVGGAIYTDLANPLTSGLEGVTVTVEGDGGMFEDVTAGPSGGWHVTDVPEGNYTVTPDLEGWCFWHVQVGVVGPPPPIKIVVDAAHQAENMSIQFLAGECTGACCYLDETCADDVTEEACLADGGRYLGDQATCDGDPDDDGVMGCDDVCPESPAPGGVDSTGRPLGDLDEDCDVDLFDWSIMQLNFTGPL